MNSHAQTQGGAIYYDLQRPVMDSTIFQNNSAEYGSDIASYPISVKLLEHETDLIDIINITSGQVYESGLQLQLVDYDGQVVLSNFTSTVSMQSIESGTRVDGTHKVTTTDGIAVFDDLILTATPGSNNVNFEVLSNFIDYQRVSVQLGTEKSSKNLTASFRLCQTGEIELNNQCVTCSPGSYSLGINQTECLLCMDKAQCLGGAHIKVDNEYSRTYNTSHDAFMCPRQDSCLGGYKDSEVNPTNCEDGYTGLLCME